jgi:actinin-like protein
LKRDVVSDLLSFRNYSDTFLQAKNLFDGDRTLVLGLMYTLIVKYEVHRYGRDVRDLLRWVQERCAPYAHRGRPDGEAPHNFTTDMRDGMALACVLHSHFDDLIDIEAMKPGNGAALENNRRVLAALERIGVPRMIEPEAMVDAAPDEKTQIACVGVMRHALEEERERREAERMRLEMERAAALEAAKVKAEAEAARHRRAAQQQQEAAAKAAEEEAAAKAKAEAELAAAMVQADLLARQQREEAARAQVEAKAAAEKVEEEAQRAAERSLLERGVRGCWLYKQSPKSYETFFRRWFVYTAEGGGKLQYFKDKNLTVRSAPAATAILSTRVSVGMAALSAFD